MARSGWGIMPITLRPSLQTPAIRYGTIRIGLLVGFSFFVGIAKEDLSIVFEPLDGLCIGVVSALPCAMGMV